jgi:hypothetical protein
LTGGASFIQGFFASFSSKKEKNENAIVVGIFTRLRAIYRLNFGKKGQLALDLV